MLWRKEQQEENTPWYRRRDYKGNLTEDEKRELDALRWSAQQPGGKHPSAEYSDLPEEVQSYISKLETELYDERGTALIGIALFGSAIGVFIVASYLGLNISTHLGSALSLWVGLFLIAISWFSYYNRECKLRSELRAGGASERIRSEWELEYVVFKRGRDRL